MNKNRTDVLFFNAFSVVLAVLMLLCGATQASAQCTEVISGLRQPLGTALTNQGNVVVSETGLRVLPGTTVTPGRISILDPAGNRRTLLDGLPSALNDVNEASGPAGILMRGRTLYVAIGVGDVTVFGGAPGVTNANPAGPSSPLFSSILAIHFSANTEKTTEGVTLTFQDQQALAVGERVTLSDALGNNVMIRLVADFPNHVPNPLPGFPLAISASNPFQLAAIEENLYVTDGGRNLVWDIDLLTGSFSTLVSFPKVANPLPIGAPMIDAVPTGIAVSGEQLLVTLFTGFPFPAGASTIEQVDPGTGNHSAFITGRRTAIDVFPVTEDGDSDFLVLQHSSVQAMPLPPFLGPGQVLRFETPTDPPTVLASCLTRPTTMTLDRKAATLYVSEVGGRIVAIPLTP
jgi:hypothetical protein